MDVCKEEEPQVGALDDLSHCSKEELLAQIKALKAHNKQLRNVIAKGSTTSKTTKVSKRSFDFTNTIFRHVLLKFYYLGWDYQGYVTQEDTTNTVEHHLFEALLKTCLIRDRTSSNYHRCGRTDKGVSSFGQVISIDLRSSRNTEQELDYCKILNRVLPENIQCVAWCPVPDSFSARFDCNSRIYRYYFPKGQLDLDKMRTGAHLLLGTHDFRNFCKMDVGNGVVEFTRNVLSVDIRPISSEDCDSEFAMYVITIEGKAFLWHQIRCILGILFLVGQGREEPSLVTKLLDVETNTRKPDYEMASEIPLNLYECQYDDVVWIYDQEATSIAIKKLREMWTSCSVKATMIKSMLNDLQLKSNEKDIKCLSECLLKTKTKRYTPVMERQLCDSLEDKINHYAKRRKNKLSNV